MESQLNEKKQDELDELLRESQIEAGEQNRFYLPIGIAFILAGIVSFIAAGRELAIGSGDIYNSRFIAICIALGFAGCLGGPVILLIHFKSGKTDRKLREQVEKDLGRDLYGLKGPR